MKCSECKIVCLLQIVLLALRKIKKMKNWKLDYDWLSVWKSCWWFRLCGLSMEQCFHYWRTLQWYWCCTIWNWTETSALWVTFTTIFSITSRFIGNKWKGVFWPTMERCQTHCCGWDLMTANQFYTQKSVPTFPVYKYLHMFNVSLLPLRDFFPIDLAPFLKHFNYILH